MALAVVLRGDFRSPYFRTESLGFGVPLGAPHQFSLWRQPRSLRDRLVPPGCAQQPLEASAGARTDRSERTLTGPGACFSVWTPAPLQAVAPEAERVPKGAAGCA